MSAIRSVIAEVRNAAKVIWDEAVSIELNAKVEAAEAELQRMEAQMGAMREALGKLLWSDDTCPECEVSLGVGSEHADECSIGRALSTDAGREFVERLEKAERERDGWRDDFEHMRQRNAKLIGERCAGRAAIRGLCCALDDAEHECDVTREMLDDERNGFEMVREALGVPFEPHQTRFERIMEAAESLANSDKGKVIRRLARGVEDARADNGRASYAAHVYRDLWHEAAAQTPLKELHSAAILDLTSSPTFISQHNGKELCIFCDSPEDEAPPSTCPRWKWRELIRDVGGRPHVGKL